MTRILIAINVIAYIAEILTGFPANRNSLFQQLTEYGPAISAGHWWIIFTSAFMHSATLPQGLLHIGFNMLVLSQLGPLVENLAGRWRMLVIYVLAIAGAGLSVYFFNYQYPTLGASGAIFGIFGAIIAFGLRLGDAGRALINQYWGFIVVNLIIGFVTPGVSNAAHIGGLITGFLAGLVFGPAMLKRATVAGAQ